MKSFAFIKPLDGASQEVGHLYEHLFIESFYEFVTSKLKVDPTVIGFVGAETFAEAIFLEAWFYDSRIASLFRSFVSHETLQKDLLNRALMQTGAESRSVFKVMDQKSLWAELTALSKDKWQTLTNFGPFEYRNGDDKPSENLVLRKNAAAYRSVIISLYAPVENLTLEERVVFLRANTLLMDLVARFVHQIGWYQPNSRSPREIDGYLVSTAGVIRSKKGMTNLQLETILKDRLTSFDWKRNAPFIRAHFRAFAKHQLWQAEASYHSHHVNAVAGNRIVARLATPKRLKSLFEKLDVRVENVSFEEVSHL